MRVGTLNIFLTYNIQLEARDIDYIVLTVD